MLAKSRHALTSQTPAELQQIILGQVDVIRGHLCRITGDMIGCLAHARQAVAQLPEVEHTPLKLRAVAMLDTARAFRWDGDVRPDKEQFALAVCQPIRAAGNSFALLNSVTNLAYLQTLQGRLRQAHVTYQEALELVTNPDQLQYLFGGVSYFFGLGDLLREQNELDEAAHYLAQGEKLVQGTISADADIVTLGYIALARLQQNQGNPQAANATLNTLIAIGQQRHFAPHLLTRAAAAQAQLWLAQNNLPAAVNWADHSQLHLTDEVAFPYESRYLALVRVRLAQNQLEGIRPLLTQLQTAAAMQHRQQASSKSTTFKPSSTRPKTTTLPPCTVCNKPSSWLPPKAISTFLLMKVNRWRNYWHNCPTAVIPSSLTFTASVKPCTNHHHPPRSLLA